MAQCVKNLTTGTWVAAEVQVQAPACCHGLKDLGMPQLPQRQSLAWELHRMWVWPSK